jgi:hypothetical protein
VGEDELFGHEFDSGENCSLRLNAGFSMHAFLPLLVKHTFGIFFYWCSNMFGLACVAESPRAKVREAKRQVEPIQQERTLSKKVGSLMSGHLSVMFL